jgi:maltose alpha-D-glucosyltransferase / alpha-amylase
MPIAHAAAAAPRSRADALPPPRPTSSKLRRERQPWNALVRRATGRAARPVGRSAVPLASHTGAEEIAPGMATFQRKRVQDPLWYKDAVLYETHVKTFFDSNDDGIGDLRGLVQKLDYLQDLGITCLWLLPLFPSPLKDDGYDISDYKGIHPDYGTLDDFRELVAAAHARGIRVLIELVVNHTSDQHPWFQRARRAPRDSPERAYYVWSDTDEKYKDARIIFTDTEKSNWTWDAEAKQYYWHRFFSHQPDLNFENPAVMREILDALSFWAELGVDAFRLDAVPYLIEQDGTNCENLPGTHEVIRTMRRYVEERFPGRMLLAEANQWPDDVRPYFGAGDECHMAFHFPLMPRIFMALRLEDVEPVVEIMRRTPAIPDTCQWALFLRNHDELTLEMVTSDERDYMYLAYSQDPRMKLNVGIRRRLAPLVDNSRRRMELLNSLLFSFPGTPIVYYGDEIGMGDNIYLHDRNGVRTPMHWSPDRNAGFSRADPARLYSAPISDPVYGYQAVNVEAELRDPSSLLHWMRNTIALRRLFKAFGRGTMEFLPVANRKVLAYVRRLDEDVLLCVANVSRFAQPAELELSQFEGYVPVEIIGYTEFPRVGKLPYFLTLGPYGFYWFELRKPT